MARRVVIGVMVLLVLLLGSLGGYYYYWRHSPRYTLWKMVQAIQQNEVDQLFHYLDLKEIVAKLAEESTADLEAWLGGSLPESKPEGDDLDRLARSLARKFARYAVPKLASALEPQIKSQVRKYIEGLSATERTALSAVVAAADIKQEGDQAWVTIRGLKNGQQLRLQLARTPQQSEWRVTEVNYADLKNLLQQRFWKESGGQLGSPEVWHLATLLSSLIMIIM